jgi:hypothetical protein
LGVGTKVLLKHHTSGLNAKFEVQVPQRPPHLSGREGPAAETSENPRVERHAAAAPPPTGRERGVRGREQASIRCDNHKMSEGLTSVDETVDNPLSRGPRISFAIIGFLSLGLGITAVFVSSNSIGTGVLLAAGALFFFMSITAKSISRAEFGGTKLEMSRGTAAQLIEAVDDAPIDVQSRVAEIIREPAKTARREGQSQADALDARVRYEQDVLESLRQSKIDARFEVKVEGSRRTLDALVKRSQRSIGVEIKYTANPAMGFMWIDQLLSILGANEFKDVDGILLVVSEVSPTLLNAIARQRRLGVVSWRSQNDGDSVVRAIDELALKITDS